MKFRERLAHIGIRAAELALIAVMANIDLLWALLGGREQETKEEWW